MLQGRRDLQGPLEPEGREGRWDLLVPRETVGIQALVAPKVRGAMRVRQDLKVLQVRQDGQDQLGKGERWDLLDHLAVNKSFPSTGERDLSL